MVWNRFQRGRSNGCGLRGFFLLHVSPSRNHSRRSFRTKRFSCFGWILGMGLAIRYNGSVHECSFAYVKINCLAILLVTCLGWWKRDPFKGCWWPPTFGDKKLTFEAPGEPLWSRPYMGRGWYLRSQPLKYPPPPEPHPNGNKELRLVIPPLVVGTIAGHYCSPREKTSRGIRME